MAAEPNADMRPINMPLPVELSAMVRVVSTEEKAESPENRDCLGAMLDI